MSVSLAKHGEPYPMTLMRAREFAAFMTEDGDAIRRDDTSLTNLAGVEISVKD